MYIEFITNSLLLEPRDEHAGNSWTITLVKYHKVSTFRTLDFEVAIKACIHHIEYDDLYIIVSQLSNRLVTISPNSPEWPREYFVTTSIAFITMFDLLFT